MVMTKTNKPRKDVISILLLTKKTTLMMRMTNAKGMPRKCEIALNLSCFAVYGGMLTEAMLSL